MNEQPTTPDGQVADRGSLSGEPCRYCHRTGGVYFVIDDSPFGKSTEQVVGCDICKNT